MTSHAPRAVARSVSYTACAVAVCIAGWLASSLLAAQAPPPFERPAIQLGPADPATESVRRVFIELRLAELEPVRGLTFEAVVKGSQTKVHLHYATVITIGDIDNARVLNSGGRNEVAVTLFADGASKLASATSRHLGRPLAIILDGDVVAVLTIRKTLDREVVFSADFTQADATRIVAGLKKSAQSDYYPEGR